jgi:DNA-binding transcriptional regulator LsrR (DeoR family)
MALMQPSKYSKKDFKTKLQKKSKTASEVLDKVCSTQLQRARSCEVAIVGFGSVLIRSQIVNTKSTPIEFIIPIRRSGQYLSISIDTHDILEECSRVRMA